MCFAVYTSLFLNAFAVYTCKVQLRKMITKAISGSGGRGPMPVLRPDPAIAGIATSYGHQ
jgi:hypothetical protein